MMCGSFTITETNLMVLYNPGTRSGLLEELQHMITYLTPDDHELHGLTQSTIKKLEGMSDEAYTALDLDPDALRGCDQDA